MAWSGFPRKQPRQKQIHSRFSGEVPTQAARGGRHRKARDDRTRGETVRCRVTVNRSAHGFAWLVGLLWKNWKFSSALQREEGKGIRSFPSLVFCWPKFALRGVHFLVLLSCLLGPLGARRQVPQPGAGRFIQGRQEASTPQTCWVCLTTKWWQRRRVRDTQGARPPVPGARTVWALAESSGSGGSREEQAAGGAGGVARGDIRVSRVHYSPSPLASLDRLLRLYLASMLHCGVSFFPS